jgi:hypothetical protein
MNKMIVAGLESSFQVFDMRTQHPQEGFAHLSEKVILCSGYYVIKDIYRAFIKNHYSLKEQRQSGLPNICLKIVTFSWPLEATETYLCTSTIILRTDPVKMKTGNTKSESQAL